MPIDNVAGENRTVTNSAQRFLNGEEQHADSKHTMNQSLAVAQEYPDSDDQAEISRGVGKDSRRVHDGWTTMTTSKGLTLRNEVLAGRNHRLRA